MKKWTGVLISLLVLILAAYYVMGIIVESTLNKNVNSIHQNLMFSVHLDNYQRSWFSSKTVLAIKMHVPDQMLKDNNGIPITNSSVDIGLKFPLTINHGPIIFTDAGIRFGIGHVTTQPQSHYQALVNYLNNTLFKYTFPSFSFQSKVGPQEFQFEMLGISALLSISPNVDKVDGNFILYGLNGTADNTLFKLGEVFNDFKFIYTPDGLWIGHAQYSVSSASLSNRKKRIFDLEAFDLSLDSNLTEGLLNFDFDFSLKNLLVNNRTYGPGVLKLRIKNLDSVAMAKIHQQQWKMIQNSQDSTLPLLAIIAEVPKLFSKGAELEIAELTVNLPEGKMTGNLKISLPKEENKDPSQLLQKAQGKGQFKAPVAAVRGLVVALIEDELNNQAKRNAQTQSTSREPVTTSTENTILPTPSATDFNAEAQKQADQKLQDLVNKGILKVDGNDYVMNLELENQHLIVNGKPFEPSMLK